MGFLQRAVPIRLAWAILAWLLGLGIPGAARADTWTPTSPSDPSRFSLDSISFEGDSELDEGELREVIRSSASGIFRFRPVDLDRLEGDVQRIRNHFRRRGYWNVVVELDLEFEHDRRKTRATFRIRRGIQRRVGKILVAGHSSFATAEILSWIRQKPDDRFDVATTDLDRKRIEERYANRGFLQVQVIADIQPAAIDATPRVNDLVYRITEGPRVSVGSIAVEGNEFTRDEIIRRELTFGPGEVLSRESVDESRTRLYTTGYFSRVEILPRTEQVPGPAVDVVVRVEERTMRFVGMGVGYGTRDQLRLSGEWGHRNLWGRAQRGTVRGILATDLFRGDGLVRTRLEGRFVEPWLFGTRTVGSTELSYEKRKEYFNEGDDSYDLRLVSLLANVSRQLSRYTHGFATVENEWADVDAAPDVTPPDDARPDITRTFSVTLDRDRRDDYFDPEVGFLNRVIGSVSGGILGGDNDFWRVQVESHWYRTVGGITFAGRVRVGYERAFGESEKIPDRARFKLGGPNTIRGYDYQDIGPGDFLLLGNTEMRFPLFWILRGGVFLDAGNAWESVGDVRWKDFRVTSAGADPDRAGETDVRYSVGVGLRVATPVGPMRVDMARKVKLLPVAVGEQSTENRWNYAISLGHVF